MRNGRTKGILPFLIIILILVSVAVFLLVEEKSPQFWVSYAAGLVAVIVVLIGVRTTIEDVNQPASIVHLTISMIYVAAVAYAVYYTCIPVRFPLKWCVAIHVLIFSVYLLISRVASTSNRYISHQERDMYVRTHKSAAIKERISRLQVNNIDTDMPYSKEISDTLSHIEDKIRYIAPPVNENAELSMADIERAIDNLEMSLNEIKRGGTGIEDFKAMAVEAERSIDLYNRSNIRRSV